MPPEGPLADFGAAWLGWDVVTGREAVQPDVTGLRDITMTPMKYGLHGTLKPPFKLAEGKTADQLGLAVAGLAASLEPTTCERMALTTLGGFLALTPQCDARGLRRVADACVRDLDPFRAPAGDAELTRRRATGLSDKQEALLTQWGYPYVMEEFRFHLTLSGRLSAADIAHWLAIVEQHLPPMEAPFPIDQIALCGERPDSRFELIQRYALTA